MPWVACQLGKRAEGADQGFASGPVDVLGRLAQQGHRFRPAEEDLGGVLGARGLDGFEQRVDDGRRFLVGVARQPFGEQRVGEPGVFGEVVEVDEIVAVDLPRERAVLQKAALGAVHHERRGVRLHEHTDDGVLRDGAVDAAVQLSPIIGRERARFETGAVVRVHALDAVLHSGGRVQRGVQREVGALRVAAHEQPARQVRRYGLQVARGLLLGGHGRGVAHVEVLAPAGDGRVGSAEAHVGEFLLVDERHGGELRLPLGIEQAEVIADDHVAKPRAGGECQHIFLHAARDEAREHMLIVFGTQCIEEVGGASRRG